MSQGFEIVRARVKDDAAVLIGRLMRSKQAEVVLVLPKNSIIAADLNSLKTLAEEAESIGKILSLNTDNEKIKAFAAKLGMPIYNENDYGKSEKIGSLKITKKIKAMIDIFPPPAIKVSEDSTEDDAEENMIEKIPELQQEELAVPEEPVIYETMNKNYDLEKNLENFYNNDGGYKNEESRQKKKPNPFSLNRIIIFFASSGLILFGVTMYLVLPEASVKISLKKIPVKAQVSVAVSKNVNSADLADGIIPGQYFSLNKTGSKTVKGTSKISGYIEIYNAYSAASQKLIAQTRFETKDGKTFRIQNSVIVPGAKMSGTKLIPSHIKTGVIGDESSDDYLIGSSYFTIPGFKESPKYAGFYAKSMEPMTRTLGASLSKEDIQKNKGELQNQLAQELKTDTLNTLKNSNLKLIDGASSVAISSFNLNANTLNMKITWQALFFKEDDLRLLVNYFMQNHFPDLKNFTFKDNITYPEASRADFKKGEIFFTISIDKNNAAPVDIGSLRKELIGRGENEMRAVISDKDYINSATISLWPFWVKNAPNNPDKINIIIDNQ